jgi:hypothetical protein
VSKEIATPELIAALDGIGWAAEPATHNDRPSALCYPPEEWTDRGEVWIILDEAGLLMEVSDDFEMPLDDWLEFITAVKGAVKA